MSSLPVCVLVKFISGWRNAVEWVTGILLLCRVERWRCCAADGTYFVAARGQGAAQCLSAESLFGVPRRPGGNVQTGRMQAMLCITACICRNMQVGAEYMHKVDWDILMGRLRTYEHEEKCALESQLESLEEGGPDRG